MAEVQIGIGERIWDRIFGGGIGIVIIKIRPNYPPVHADRCPLGWVRTGRVIISGTSAPPFVLNVDLHTA